MSKWRDLEPADMSTFETAPLIYRFPVKLAVSPERVWESLASDKSVSEWGLGVKSLRWTSPRPFGVGTTREVVLPLSVMTLREHFFRWDEGQGYSFYVTQANRGFYRRFAENYVVEPDGSGALFTWTIALEPTPRMAPLMRAMGPLNKRAFGEMARGAKKFFAANP